MTPPVVEFKDVKFNEVPLVPFTEREISKNNSMKSVIVEQRESFQVLNSKVFTVFFVS
jgi:hypothetical protein